MKILALHSNSIDVKVGKKALKEGADEEPKNLNVEDALVVLTAVEDGDVPKNVAKEFKQEVEKIMEQVKADKIVLYPYAHLSSKLAAPAIAKETLDLIENEMKDHDFYRAPFGYYKAFDISVKGHPLAELSREIKGLGKDRGGKQDKKKQTKRTKEELEDYAEHDHRRIGKELDLFSFHEFAPGQPFFHKNGTILWQQLEKLMENELRDRGYDRVRIPVLWSKEIYETSGHWGHYRENLFEIEGDDHHFAIKPMNCPAHGMLFKSKTRSYRDLPLRFAEWTTLYRNELSGVLSGLFRVLALTQDDAHIYCREDQMEDEIIELLNLIADVYKKFGFEYTAKLSTRPEDNIGSDELWEKAESVLENSLKKNKIKYELKEGDGAFYGPKIDIDIKDSLGREWQCATIQLDFNQADRFGLTYIGDDGENHKPVVLHRVVYGSFERFIGILTEHYQGNFPTWLAPIQATVLSITDENKQYAESIFDKLKLEGIRVEIDTDNETLQNKIRQWSLKKVPYQIILGNKEEESETIAVRGRDGKTEYKVKLDDFISKIKEESI